MSNFDTGVTYNKCIKKTKGELNYGNGYLSC